MPTKPKKNPIDLAFIRDIESRYFRTESDTGADGNALFIWNLVRNHVGLEGLTKADLPCFCRTHSRYHKIQPEYGCSVLPMTSGPHVAWITKYRSALNADLAVEGEIIRLTQSGQWIQAIKLMREKTGWGLKEAKDAIDMLRGLV